MVQRVYPPPLSGPSTKKKKLCVSFLSSLVHQFLVNILQFNKNGSSCLLSITVHHGRGSNLRLIYLFYVYIYLFCIFMPLFFFTYCPDIFPLFNTIANIRYVIFNFNLPTLLYDNKNQSKSIVPGGLNHLFWRIIFSIQWQWNWLLT